MAEGTEQPATATAAVSPATEDAQKSIPAEAEPRQPANVDTLNQKDSGDGGPAGTPDGDSTEDDNATKEEDVEEEPLGEYAEVKPSAIFMTGATQAIFAFEVDKDVTPENPQKIVTLEAIKADMQQRAAVSDFSVYKKEWNVL